MTTHSAAARKTTAFDRVDPRVLTSFPELVDGLGGDPHALLRRVGIDPERLGQQRAVVGYRQMIDLVADAAADLNCPDFGMRLARLQADAIDSPLREVVRNSATLGEALDHVIDLSYAHSPAAGIWLRSCQSDGTVTVGHDILIDDLPDPRQAIEQFLLVEYLTCLQATGGLARARRVEFRHQPISSPAVYRSHFGCDARFGQPSDAIVYGEQALACPIVSRDPTTCRQTIANINAAFAGSQPPLHAAVRRLVTHLLGSEGCTNLHVATELGLHTRTLHRGLTREGTSFQQIKNQVRRNLLVHYLDRTDLSISEISERLGFAEQSAMTRFCRKALAVSPTDHRARAKRLS